MREMFQGGAIFMVNIFRELNYLDSVLLERSMEKSDSLLGLRCGLVERVRTWVKSASYSSYKNKRIFLDAQFNYAGVANVDAILARKLNIKQASVRLIRKRLSEEAVALLGNNIAEKVLQGDEAVLKRLSNDLTTLEKGVVVASELFPIEVLEAIRKYSLSDEVFPLGECKSEVNFLRGISLENIQRLMLDEVFSAEKMNYIIKILDEPSHKAYKSVLRAVTSGINTGGNA
jgi:hypothetical protein